MTDQNTITDLQILVMEQERSIESLSQQVVIQGKQLDTLNRKLALLEAKLTAVMQDTGQSPSAQSEVPPHY